MTPFPSLTRRGNQDSRPGATATRPGRAATRRGAAANYYHVPPRFYGLLFGSVILGIMAVNTLNARLVPRFGSDRLLRWGAALAAVAGVAATVAGWTGWGGLAALALSMVGFCGLNGLIVANSLAGALSA